MTGVSARHDEPGQANNLRIFSVRSILICRGDAHREQEKPRVIESKEIRRIVSATGLLWALYILKMHVAATIPVPFLQILAQPLQQGEKESQVLPAKISRRQNVGLRGIMGKIPGNKDGFAELRHFIKLAVRFVSLKGHSGEGISYDRDSVFNYWIQDGIDFPLAESQLWVMKYPIVFFKNTIIIADVEFTCESRIKDVAGVSLR